MMQAVDIAVAFDAPPDLTAPKTWELTLLPPPAGRISEDVRRKLRRMIYCQSRFPSPISRSAFVRKSPISPLFGRFTVLLPIQIVQRQATCRSVRGRTIYFNRSSNSRVRRSSGLSLNAVSSASRAASRSPVSSRSRPRSKYASAKFGRNRTASRSAAGAASRSCRRSRASPRVGTHRRSRASAR